MRLPTRRAVPLLLACALLASACTRTPPGGQGAVGFAPSPGDGSGIATDGGLTLFDGDSDGSEFAGTPGSGDGLPGTPGTTEGIGTAGRGRPGSSNSAGPGSSGDGAVSQTAPAGSHFGIDGRTIKIVYHTKLEPCGDDPSTSDEGVANEKGLKVLTEYVRWYNEEVFGPHGWQIALEIVDDGGRYCAEKARAAARRIVQEIRPFAVIGVASTTDSGPVLADIVTRAGIPHIGTNWETFSELKARQPYAWPVVQVTEMGFRNLFEYMERRVVGTQVPNATTGTPEDRSYGVLLVDDSAGRELAKIAVDGLRSLGIEPTGLYFLPPDPGVAAQQSTNLALRMRQDGVNSLVWGIPYTSYNSAIVFTEAMNGQNYLPEILTGISGVAFVDQLFNKRVWENARGVSAGGIVALRIAVEIRDGAVRVDERFEEIAENNEGYVAVWQRLGYEDNPQDGSVPGGYGVFANLGLLATGVLNAGDVLNPETFGASLDSSARGGPNRCVTARFVGRDYAWQPIFDWTTQGTGGARGFTTIYWVNRQTSLNTVGYWESEDNYRIFDSGADLPPQPSHDTGERPLDVPKQERIGLRPWTPCSQFPNYPAF